MPELLDGRSGTPRARPDLPTWTDGEPEPWWIERGYMAWVRDLWARANPVPFKRSKRTYGR